MEKKIRKIRNDKGKERVEIRKCKFCDYQNKHKRGFLIHMLNHHSNKQERKKKYKFYCDMCDFGTFSLRFFKIHNEKNVKHLRNKNNNLEPFENI